MGTIPGFLIWFGKDEFCFSCFSSLFGGILSVLGFVGIYKTVSLFTTYGDGTPAPYDPPKKFVAKGLYRYVRNPMMIGVFLVLLGESVFFRSYLVLIWTMFFVAVNLIYIPLFEEPELINRFGASYLKYKNNVPRWLPNKRPYSWNP